MPKGQYFSYSVVVGKEKQEEYAVDSKQYVSVDLHSQHSFVLEETETVKGEEETQKYPVTPFSITITKHHDSPCWFTIYMDGQRIKSLPITTRSQSTRTVEGYKSGRQIRELLFSLPRISKTKTVADGRQVAAGTIMIVCEQGIPQCLETVKVPQTISRNFLPSSTSYPQLTKKDMASIKGGMGIVCREGRTTQELSYTNCQYRTRYRVSRGDELERIVLHYGSKEALTDLGIGNDISAEVMTKMTNVTLNKSSEKKKKSEKPKLPRFEDKEQRDPNQMKDSNNDDNTFALQENRNREPLTEIEESQTIAEVNEKPNNENKISKKLSRKSCGPVVLTGSHSHTRINLPDLTKSNTDSVRDVLTDITDSVRDDKETAEMQSATRLKQEQMSHHEKTEVMSPYSKTSVSEITPMSPAAIKEEIKKEEEDCKMVELSSEMLTNNLDDYEDDDVVYVETVYIKREPKDGSDLDDSVVCMGDDSCYMFDMPEEEVSILNISEFEN